MDDDIESRCQLNRMLCLHTIHFQPKRFIPSYIYRNFQCTIVFFFPRIQLKQVIASSLSSHKLT